jgi:phage head maturation protease
VTTATDPVPMREFVARGAWDDFLRDVADGRADCELRDCHQLGNPLASVGEGTLTFTVDPLAGLLAVATLADGPWERMLFNRAAAGGIGVSVAFSDVVHRHVSGSGSRRRAIVKARLRHIALVGVVSRDRGEPAYPQARAFAAAAGDAAAFRRAMQRARGGR